MRPTLLFAGLLQVLPSFQLTAASQNDVHGISVDSTIMADTLTKMDSPTELSLKLDAESETGLATDVDQSALPLMRILFPPALSFTVVNYSICRILISR